MKCLLLNSSYDGLAFVSEIKGLKLYFNDKVEVISNWDETISWSSGSMKIPAILKLKYYVKYVPRRSSFNRLAVFRRDQYCCMYCNRALSKELLTIDHIIPKSRGGLTIWTNTCASCGPCNILKNDRTPEEAGMRLLRKPIIPEIRLKNSLIGMTEIHKDWEIYLK